MNLEEQLKDFLDGKVNVVKLDNSAVSPIANALEKLGATVDHDNFDTNGWQWDWWLPAKYQGKKISLSGCGYYGGATIAWDTDYEDEDDYEEEE